MSEKNQNIQQVLVIGAGRGGSAMLELFLEDPLIKIVGIMDSNSQAPAIEIAKNNGIQTFTDLVAAVKVSAPCLAFNLTGDDAVTAYVEAELGRENVVGGFQARFLWNLLTRLKKTNDQVTYLAQHDTLTGLPNRMLFYDRLNQAITRAHREKEAIAVFFLDLDGFKQVNDTLGHDVGDALLREAAQRIQSCVRDSDTVARMGGDEFTVILTNIKSEGSKDRVAEKIIEEVGRPFMLNGKDCSVSVSIGIALYPENGDTPEQLIKIADAAMYMAKNAGKNCYKFLGV
ncbi:MAG: diguanylate cyclase [Gallionellaceae bacterium]|nr:diguanylate cyclase [Gallionellaceae bacterium]